MVITEEYKFAVSEVLDVIKHMDEQDIDKIPMETIVGLNKNKLNNYVSCIDFTKPLEQSNISNTATKILAYIYREYLCSEEEKKEFNKILLENHIKHENELKSNFTNEDIFKKSSERIIDNLPVEIVKENIFKKILNKIKRIFIKK